MKARDVVIGFIFLVLLIAGSLWIIKNRNKSIVTLPVQSPSISQKVQNAFPSLKVPEGATRADLSNVAGTDGVGVATKQKTNNGYSVTVMVNLPDEATKPYEATMTNGTETINLGKLSLTKSGYLVNFTTAKDLSAYNKVTVTLDGNRVLEGSF